MSNIRGQGCMTQRELALYFAWFDSDTEEEKTEKKQLLDGCDYLLIECEMQEQEESKNSSLVDHNAKHNHQLATEDDIVIDEPEIEKQLQNSERALTIKVGAKFF